MTLHRRANAVLQEIAPIDLDLVAAVSATTIFPIATMERDYAITKFELEVPGGYTADASNYYVITLQTGAGSPVVLATWSTLTSAQGSLTTLVFSSAVLSTPPTGVSGDQLNIACTKHASAVNIPAQTRFRVHAKLL
jgi:hypothetical protein